MYTLPHGHVLVLRCCDAALRSYGGFQWPTEGLVEAPDWRDNNECGHGLHGWLWGEGDITAAGDTANARDSKWLVVEVRESDIREIDKKVKYPRGRVVCCGTTQEASGFLRLHGGHGRAIICGTATAGDGGTATAGDGGAIQLTLWDRLAERRRIKTGYIGEDGLEPNVPYKLDAEGKFVRADTAPK